MGDEKSPCSTRDFIPTLQAMDSIAKFLKIRSAALVLLVAAHGWAEEGMWTYDNFPSSEVKRRYGFEPTPGWLEHVRLASAKLAQGCSGSFVSSAGLVLTNHHCVSRCLEQLSSEKEDRLASGFYAQHETDELRCPALEIDQLLKISDVTDRVHRATQGLSGARFHDAQRAEIAKIEKECATNNEVRCDVITLYQGGRYHLYEHRRFQDVRIVFAPERDAARFGGELDNFMFPRYDLDAAFLRVYQNGRPAQTSHYFRWSFQDPREGDVTFVSGNPGRTNRDMTMAQLEFEREVSLPTTLFRLLEERGWLKEFQTRGPEQRRISTGRLSRTENSIKVYKGRLGALNDRLFFASKVAAERAFRAKTNRDPEKKRLYGAAWDAIEQSVVEFRRIRAQYNLLELGFGFQSELFTIARQLVRASEELPKPNQDRLREFADSRLPALTHALFSPAPIHDELEIESLSFSLDRFREQLGPDDPMVKKMFAKTTPRELAESLVRSTQLKGVEQRKLLFDGGKSAIQSSPDQMIVFAKSIDPEARAVRKQFEEAVEAPQIKNGELIAKARFELYGTSIYPDATFSARLSYGQIKGFPQSGKQVPPFTYFRGAFERATGKDPFILPRRWLDGKSRLNPNTPENFCTTHDVIGGNSGSPVINREAEIVGVIFDGNLASLGGDYGYDGRVNRAVAVHSAAIFEALEKLYGASRLTAELRPEASASGRH
jgi:hypothetical protein